MRAVIGLFALLAAAACGGSGDSEPEELVPDPAVETGCLSEPVESGQSRAKVIECAEEVPGGLLASGRVGDIVLENGEVEFVIRGFGQGYYFLGTGPGGIVDAALVGRDDQLKELLSLAEINSAFFDEIVITEAGDDGPAEVTMRGPLAPFPFVSSVLPSQSLAAILEQKLSLDPNGRELRIETRVIGLEDQIVAAQITDFVVTGGALTAWQPGAGFELSPAGAEALVFFGGSTSYGLTYPELPLSFLEIRSVLLANGPIVSGESAVRYFIVGDGSAASVTDRVFPLRGESVGTVAGQVEPAVAVDVEILDHLRTKE